jgi:enoyl-CoA hydratase/carnithine racemase
MNDVSSVSGETVDRMTRVVLGRPAAGVVALELRAPRRGNALSTPLVAELIAALSTVAHGGDGRVLVIRSSSRVFCSGFDLREPVRDDSAIVARFAQIQVVLELLADMPLVTVACVAGAAVGAGADLVAACDYRLASAEAEFRFPGARFGLVLGLRRLSAVVGADAARDLVLRAKKLSAQAALEGGLVTAVMPAGEMDAFVEELAAGAGPLDPDTLAMIVRALRSRDGAGDAGLLAWSATKPGLARRVEAYAGSRREPRPAT